jgi:GH24 family phage-related lysozyme (muramidase)
MKIFDLSDSGVEFIVKEETGGKDYYEKVYKSTFVWPKGFSGPTAMVGIDIGYYTEEEINLIFKPLTNKDELELIQAGRGKKGESAREYTLKLKGITFTWEEAIQTFEEFILPKFINLTAKTFPGAEKLEDKAKTALTSLVFNRGTSLKGDSRKEMLEIRNIILSKNIDYKKIASLFRNMKRLWDKTSGLVGRREREAKLIETC